MDGIVHSIVASLSGKTSSEIMIPLLELRGSILAAGFMETTFVPTYISAVLGNMLPIPFILVFITKVFEFMEKIPKLEKIPKKIKEKAMSKSDKIQKYGYFGLFLFVAIPLPGTGAWTGALLSVLLGLKKGKSLLAILLGVMSAGLIMSLIAFGVIQNII